MTDIKTKQMKERYILIWDIRDYFENGGGQYHCFVEDDIGDTEELENKVNEIMKDERATISFCGTISDEIKIVPVEKVTKWKVKEE